VAYINVPYCETRCFYCLFYIKPYRNKEESKAFADTLIKELQLWSDKPVQKGVELSIPGWISIFSGKASTIGFSETLASQRLMSSCPLLWKH